jgi:hypothetical protein
VSSRFRLQFDPAHIREIAQRYDYPGEAEAIAIGRSAGDRGFYTADELVRVAGWKTRNRVVPLVLENPPKLREAASRTALDPAVDEAGQVAALRALRGVRYPVASALLHLAGRRRYPMIDQRALESLGYFATSDADYSASLWRDYVETCRALAREHRVSMRVLDRALWTWPGLTPAEQKAWRAAR